MNIRSANPKILIFLKKIVVGEDVGATITSNRERARTQNDDSGGAVTDLFVLCARELQHALSGRVADFDLTEDRVTVIRQDNRA